MDLNHEPGATGTLVLPIEQALAFVALRDAVAATHTALAAYQSVRDQRSGYFSGGDYDRAVDAAYREFCFTKMRSRQAGYDLIEALGGEA